jgi:hypothetical protein
MDQDVFGRRAKLITREAGIWATGEASAYVGARARG